MDQPGTPGFPSRRALLQAGLGTALGAAILPPFLRDDTGSRVAAVIGQGAARPGGDSIDLRFSSRSGRVVLAPQRVTLLPAASALWLAQQLTWRARGLDVSTAPPTIRALTPARARVFYATLVGSYTGAALVAGTAWHAAMAAALDAHRAEFVHPHPNGQSDTPVRPGDGLYSFTLNEALNQAAERGWRGSRPDEKTEAFKKRLEDAASRGGLPTQRGLGEAAGGTAVIDFWRGEVHLFGASALQGVVGDFGGGVPSGATLDLSPADDTSDFLTGTAEAGAGIATLGACLAQPELIGVGAGLILFVGVVRISTVALKSAGAAGVSDAYIQGKNDRPRGGASGSDIPAGGEEAPQNAQNRPHVRLPTNGEMTDLLLNDFRYRHVGSDGIAGDVSKGQSFVMGVRQSFDRITHTMGWTLALKEGMAGQLAKEADETGQLWREWLRDMLHPQLVPADAYGPAAGNGLDVLGKKPSVPPRPAALAVDVQGPVLSRGAHDLTVQATVVR